MPLPTRRLLPASALAAAACLIGYSGGVQGLPTLVLLGLALVCGVGLIGQSLDGTRPTWLRRWAQCCLMAWLLALSLGLGLWLRVASDVPVGIWWLGLVLLPLLNGLISPLVALPLWALCFSVALATVLSWTLAVWPLAQPPWTPLMLQQALATGAWWGSVLAGLAGLLGPRLPAAPAAAPQATTGFDLPQHLDSPEAQEGADKYTRE